jgi:hypothetical protein
MLSWHDFLPKAGKLQPRSGRTCQSYEVEMSFSVAFPVRRSKQFRNSETVVRPARWSKSRTNGHYHAVP